MRNVPVAILGAGIAGLGASLRARELGLKAVVFEAGRSAGGLLDNFTIEGFRFDYAVHLSFANEPEVRSIFDRTPYFTHPADSQCFERSIWLKHPVQNNLFPLPAEERVELIKSFISRPNIHDEQNYESWLRHQYGHAIAERYPLKYTLKYWDTPANQLSTIWIGDRMRRAKLDEILYGSLSPETPNYYYTKEMRYPKTGGYKSFIQPLIDSAEIHFNHQCCRIDLGNKELHFNTGATIGYHRLVSTLPLPELISTVYNAPEEIVNSAKKLRATSIDLISVGFRRPLINKLWFYIYDDDIFASRAYSPSVKSPENAPPGCSSMQFEIYSRGVQSKYESEELKENTIKALRRMKIATEKDIAIFDHRRIRYGNVIFDKEMDVHRLRVLNWCKAVGISSCGRFGKWDYLWSNQSLMSGYNSLM